MAGVLFLAAFLTYGTGNALVSPVVAVADPLAGAAASPTQLRLGAVLMLANSGVVAGIGVLLFPILRRYDERIAVGYWSTQIVEAMLLAVGVVALLALVPLSDGHLVAEAGSGQTLGGLAVAVNDVAYEAGMAALGLGSVFFVALLRRARLVPRPLAVWGLVGYAALLAGAVLELLGVGVGLLLAVPGGLFEIVFAIWLIAKGFAPDTVGASVVTAR